MSLKQATCYPNAKNIQIPKTGSCLTQHTKGDPTCKWRFGERKGSNDEHGLSPKLPGKMRSIVVVSQEIDAWSNFKQH
ncbi:uncharacterized protein N7458_000264 [Penicillium daleae]|uniref:Uncharacterized protein n=1 Tax=Penicillium daleae TaxID=63821 RepID=A0AAD6G793_9EURO|nr:uncharacterized protein N7458_000264 [Penicillium daleae]KAJ5464578.1 hypothetical protein N7458_000264 [Penicillium daleae]